MLTWALKAVPSLLPLRMSKDEYCYATYRGGTTCLCTSMIKLLAYCKVWHIYCSEAHNTLSTIDHILSPQHLLPRFSNSSVFEEEPTNLSEHSPVCTNFECVLQSPSLSATSVSSTDKQIKVNWAKLSKDEIYDCYTACVESKLSSLTLPDPSELVSNPSLTDTHLESIVRILLATAFDSIPIKKFSPHVGHQS